jgi:hypothetical protein
MVSILLQFATIRRTYGRQKAPPRQICSKQYEGEEQEWGSRKGIGSIRNTYRKFWGNVGMPALPEITKLFAPQRKSSAGLRDRRRFAYQPPVFDLHDAVPIRRVSFRVCDLNDSGTRIIQFFEQLHNFFSLR